MRKAFLGRTNVNLIGVGKTGGFRSFFTANKLIETADDLASVKMRVVNAQLPVQMEQLLGANPIPVA